MYGLIINERIVSISSIPQDNRGGGSVRLPDGFVYKGERILSFTPIDKDVKYFLQQIEDENNASKKSLEDQKKMIQESINGEPTEEQKEILEKSPTIIDSKEGIRRYEAFLETIPTDNFEMEQSEESILAMIQDIKIKCGTDILEKYSAHDQANMTARISEINTICLIEGRLPNDDELADIAKGKEMIDWIRERREQCAADILKITN